MKKILVALMILSWSAGIAQEIPLFSQKLTNSFIYNPALAGQSTGSLTYTYRKSYSNIEGAPQDHFLSLHTPFSNYRFGAGINLYHETVNFVKNTFVTTAFAWHLRPDRYKTFSAGVAVDFGTTVVSRFANTNGSTNDPVLNDYENRVPKMDVSFGVHYQTRYVKTGFALNRISSTWIQPRAAFLENFFSSYVQGRLPARDGKDRFEPYISLRKYSHFYYSWDAGIFYTYESKIIGGATLRTGNIINTTLGFLITDKTLLGYSREIIGTNIGRQLGATNEITLRVDFGSYDKRRRTIGDCIAYDPNDSKATQSNHRTVKRNSNKGFKSTLGSKKKAKLRRKRAVRQLR
jgi:type IX secretion system PorP/SprF family membrane protein